MYLYLGRFLIPRTGT